MNYTNAHVERLRNYKVDHRTFGGIIKASDYCTDSNSYGIDAARRTESDFSFDRQCQKNYDALSRINNAK